MYNKNINDKIVNIAEKIFDFEYAHYYDELMDQMKTGEKFDEIKSHRIDEIKDCIENHPDIIIDCYKEHLDHDNDDEEYDKQINDIIDCTTEFKTIFFSQHENQKDKTMKVIDTRTHTNPNYSDLSQGDCFEYNGNCYMKIVDRNGQFDAVPLTDKYDVHEFDMHYGNVPDFNRLDPEITPIKTTITIE